MVQRLKWNLAGLFILVPLLSLGQQQDLQLWTRTSLKYDLNKKSRIYIEEELRFKNNIRHLSKLHTELGWRQKLSKQWKISGYYRLTNLRDSKGYFENRHRLSLQATWQPPVNILNFWISPRLQYTWHDFSRSPDWRIPEKYFRCEAGVSKKSINGKFEPHADVEAWYALRTGTVNIIDQYRLTLGLEYKIDRNRRWDFFYRYQQEIQVNDPLTAYIVGVAYTYLIR